VSIHYRFFLLSTNHFHFCSLLFWTFIIFNSCQTYWNNNIPEMLLFNLYYFITVHLKLLTRQSKLTRVQLDVYYKRLLLFLRKKLLDYGISRVGKDHILYARSYLAAKFPWTGIYMTLIITLWPIYVLLFIYDFDIWLTNSNTNITHCIWFTLRFLYEILKDDLLLSMQWLFTAWLFAFFCKYVYFQQNIVYIFC